jgi:hypothetical protein
VRRRESLSENGNMEERLWLGIHFIVPARERRHVEGREATGDSGV